MTTTPTLTLTAFLEARIADTIATAREVQALAVTRGIQPDDSREPALRLARATLAECEAHRWLLALHYELDGGAPETYPYTADDGRTVWPGCAVCDDGSPRRQYCDTVRILATMYRDHPDYREDWRP